MSVLDAGIYYSDYKTGEIFKQTLEDFIVAFCTRKGFIANFNFVSKEVFENYAVEHEIKFKKSITKANLIKKCIHHMSREELLDFCNEYGIGVSKNNILAKGYSDADYWELSHYFFETVGKEYYDIDKYKYLYSIRDYLKLTPKVDI